MASGWERDSQPANHQPDTPYAPSDLPYTAPVSRPPAEQSLPSRSRIPSISSTNGRPRGLSTVSSTSSVRRKPLPSTASPLATRFSTTAERVDSPLSITKSPSARPYSISSPTVPENTTHFATPSTSGDIPGPETAASNLNETTLSISPTTSIINNSKDQTESPARPSSAKGAPSTTYDVGRKADYGHVRLISDSVYSTTSDSSDPTLEYYNTAPAKETGTQSMLSPKPTPPHLLISSNATSGNISNDPKANPNLHKQLPKSPGASKLGSFFGWGGSTSPASSTTTFSEEKSFSPRELPQKREVSGGIDVPRANAKYDNYFGDAYKQLPPITPETNLQVEEMEEELKTITAELATSIRREMELEDLVERLQSEAAYHQSPGKRTSDYFSDSGTSSVKYGGEGDIRTDELDRLHRKAEREKAQIKVELTDKVHDERSRRRALEGQIRLLTQKASQVDLGATNSPETSGRLRVLEATCEDLRRRLAEERQVKDNFEDLLTALRGELQKSHNERDNLRDEVVPQLRARVEGLEAQAGEHEKLTYEHTKMQQEMQALKNEKTRFNSIMEEGSSNPPRSAPRVTRSNSVAQGSGLHRPTRPPSLSRSSSVKGNESREVLAERVKDVEAQRDALHRALKGLLERQEYQNRENDKRIRSLEMERDRALTNTPRRQGYNKEVASLRDEINTLRRRADEAIEQKWQCEKGLSGLKMDLERAEQEIGSLRRLLQDNSHLGQNGIRQVKGERGRSGSSASDALELAYQDLQEAYAESLERITKLEASGPKDEDTEKALTELQQRLSEAVNERDFARREAEAYSQSAASLQSHERAHISSETVLADELRASAKRVEELATQVRQQLASNATLRQRLAETIDRGEKEQKANTSRIVHMQSRLRSLEDALMSAQQASEERVQHHEEEIRVLRESHNKQLLRVKEGVKSPRAFGPRTPLSPMFAGDRSPRLEATTSGRGISIGEESQADLLKTRVVELEKALEDADREMQEVVSKMNIAQIEVMELQNEREESVRLTKRLQAKIEEERLRTFEERFATLRS